MTKDVATHSRNADAVFVAGGKPNLITANMLKSGSRLIDIGINRVTDDQGKAEFLETVILNHVQKQPTGSLPYSGESVRSQYLV